MITKLITAVEPEVFEKRLNGYLEEVWRDRTKIKEIKYTVTALGNSTLYTALIIKKTYFF